MHMYNTIITFRYINLHHAIIICIHAIIGVIKCGNYPLSTYEVMSVLNYFLNLYAILNNEVISICKFE
jgi:hypothetical protein